MSSKHVAAIFSNHSIHSFIHFGNPVEMSRIRRDGKKYYDDFWVMRLITWECPHLKKMLVEFTKKNRRVKVNWRNSKMFRSTLQLQFHEIQFSTHQQKKQQQQKKFKAQRKRKFVFRQEVEKEIKHSNDQLFSSTRDLINLTLYCFLLYCEWN